MAVARRLKRRRRCERCGRFAHVSRSDRLTAGLCARCEDLVVRPLRSGMTHAEIERRINESDRRVWNLPDPEEEEDDGST